jgi:phage baseplate assembly protein W
MANISDKSGQATAVSIVTRKKPWADLDLELGLHPINKDIIPLRDDAAIKNSVKNLILTNIYERPFQPFLAGNLRGLLFEPASVVTEYELKQSIKDVINLYEPRITIENINITDDHDNNTWNITIFFRIKQFGTSTSVGIVLERLR